MLRASNSPDECVTSAHRGKLAYIYVRQSSVNQVRHHQESTELQYRLVDRAVALGWPHERVHVIDEDLGKSGAGTVERVGFKKPIAEIGLGNAGLAISLDASRLARNNRDWHQLLDLCALFGVIIADGERLYDPCAYHDRLLLGLSGIMSEAELHQIRQRLHQGERRKAARGYGASGRAMRRKEHGANMMRSSRRTAWWRGRWSAAGKRSCARPKRSNRIMNDGGAMSPWC